MRGWNTAVTDKKSEQRVDHQDKKNILVEQYQTVDFIPVAVYLTFWRSVLDFKRSKVIRVYFLLMAQINQAFRMRYYFTVSALSPLLNTLEISLILIFRWYFKIHHLRLFSAVPLWSLFFQTICINLKYTSTVWHHKADKCFTHFSESVSSPAR